MQPSLALTYTSGGGNGHLGVGWSLSGLSEIRRCHKTKATEGLPDGVDFDETDSFCLDGQKLRQINGADVPNGFDGAEYRTERDSFSKITAHGDVPEGPDSFTVQSRNGQIFDYEKRVAPHRFQGGSDDVSPEDLGEVRAVWLISQARDQSGNKMRYAYDVLPNATTHGMEYRVKSITYTETYDGQKGQRSVEFHYTAGRPDPTFRYESGVRWETNSLLDKITLKGPNPVMKEALGEYRLEYLPSPDTDRSLLSSVKRCDNNNACLRAKQLRWWERTIPDRPPVELDSVQITPWDTAATAFPNAILVADFNGDGLDDILYRVRYSADYQPIFLRLAQKSGEAVFFGAEIQMNPAGDAFSTAVLSLSRAVDIDGDGRNELLTAINPYLDYASPFVEAGYIVFSLNSGTMEFEPQGELLPGDLALDVVQLTDVNGDGLPDMFREQPDASQVSGPTDLGEWLLALNQGGEFPNFQPSGLISAQGQWARAMDVDGDGRGDLLPIDWATVPAGTSDSSDFPGSTVALGIDDTGHLDIDARWSLDELNHQELVDLNGDGLKDALYPDGNVTRVRWNLGNGFGPLEPMVSGIVKTQSTGVLPELGLRSADFDGDGIEDIVSFDNNDLPGGEHIRLFRMRGGDITGSNLGFAGTAPFQTDVENPDGSVSTVQMGWPYCKLADFNGDGLTDISHALIEWTTDENGVAHASFQLRALIQKFAPSDVLMEVTDEDATLPTESVFYFRTAVNDTSSCAWPQRCVRQSVQVVASTAANAGGDCLADRWKYYTYEDPRMDLWGRGFLGFGKVTVFDPQLRAQTITTFDHETRIGTLYPYAGLPKNITHIAPIFDTPTDDTQVPDLPDGDVFARVTSIDNTYAWKWTNAGAGTYVVHPVGSTTTELESQVSVSSESVALVGGPTETPRIVVTHTLYDAYENAKVIESYTWGGTSRYATFEYENRPDDWILGLPVRSEVLVEDWDGQAPEPRVTTSEFDERGLLRTVTVEPDHPELRRVTRFLRNDDGLPYRVIVTANGGQRNTFVAYDEAERMFPVATWNELAHYNRAVFHPGYGVPIVTDDPNQVKTEYAYDRFGRVRRVVPAAGTAGSISYASDECNTDLASTKGLCTSVHHDDGARHVEYSDEYGRTWEVGDTGFDGALVFRRREFNAFGQPVRTTRPFTENAGPGTMVTFDSLSRPQGILYPDATTTSFAHTMYTRRTTDGNGTSSYVTRDLNGRIVEIEDASGPPRTYSYGPFDQIVAIEQLGYTTAIEYDKMGRRTRLDDPDQGVTAFTYNGFGELLTSKHLVGGNATLPDLVTELQYDDLGRTRLRADTVDDDPADAVPPAVETTEYQYDATPHGLGKLRRTVSPDGIETVHTYDQLGRPKLTEWNVDGSSYKFEQSYDDWGRLTGLRYPEADGKTFELNYGYTPGGWLRGIARHTNAVWPQPTPIWQITARNSDGMLAEAEWKGDFTESRMYNSLTGRLHTIDVTGDGPLLGLTYGYDPVGNVTLREDSVGQGRTETFEYDSADRLELWTLKYPPQNGDTGERITFYTYDDLGNLMGTMVNWLLDEVHTSDPVRPHRLASINFLQGQGLREYSHDGHGRQDQDTDGRQIQYTPFDLPRHIGQNGSEAHFAYDAFGSRVKKTSFENGVVTTTITVGGVYERRERAEANAVEVQHVFYVEGDDGPVAQVMYDETSDVETTAYLARDGLGSVGVVFDKNGTEIERLYHEPFGLRTGVDGAPLPSFVSTSDVSLGFTGQKHDDDLDLIDMNGRVYDPVQKRFLTPDPVVSNPFFSQSYNRYAYVLNNPLRYTDPSGFQEQPSPSIFDRAIAEILKLFTPAPKPAPPPTQTEPKPTEKPKQSSQPTGGSSDGTGKTTPPPPPVAPTTTTKPDPETRPEFVAPYDRKEQYNGGYAAGLVISGVPFGGPIALALINNGILAPGTPESREGLAKGMIAGGIAWSFLRPSAAVPPGAPMPAMPGGGPAPPVAVAPADVGVLVGAGVLVNAGAGAGELTTTLSTGGGAGPSTQPTAPQYKIPVTGSGAAKASDVPSWVRSSGQRPLVGESGKNFARRVMDQKYGEGQWKDVGPASEFSMIKKWGDRAFVDPK